MLSYDFGNGHPLKPERLARAVRLLEAVAKVDLRDPGPGERADALRVHDRDYVRVVEALSVAVPEEDLPFGFGPGDNPPFAGMHEAALAYTSGSARAAEAVRDGAPLAFNLSGGLHHAQRARASGFCIYNDPAVAIAVLRERFDRVAYVDIDVHHGDGVQALFYDDPSVLTYSIHETGHAFYPGSGFVEETGLHFTSVNVPLPPYTGGTDWLWAFRETVVPALDAFRPGALVLQHGTDTHELDPLAHLRLRAQDWLEAVRVLTGFGLPVVALGGGGYHLHTVPRMWVAAVLVLAGLEVPNAVPSHLAAEWGMPSFFDEAPAAEEPNTEEVESVVRRAREYAIANIGS